MANFNPNMTLYTVKGVLILDNQGNKLLTKYYSEDLKDKALQDEIEAELAISSEATDGKIIVFKDYIILYKDISDLTFFIIGGVNENEVLLHDVLNVLCESLASTIKPTLDRASLVQKYEKLILVLDQTIEDGIILTCDGEKVISKISKGGMGLDAFSSDQMIVQYIQKAQEHLVNTLM